jgi:hypothetical protein
MSANIEAIRSLFPANSAIKIKAAEAIADSFTIGGPCPFDAYLASGVNFMSPTFVAAVEHVRADEYYGPLYRGDLTKFDEDHSRGEMALAGAFARLGLDAWGVDVAMRTSALYREKWERDDYRKRTIARAIEGARKLIPATYGPAAETHLDLKMGEIAVSLDDPPPRDYVIDGLLSPGKSAILGGFGGVSKTQLALQICVAIVLGALFLEKPVKEGRALAILGEEDADEIKRRVSAIARRGSLSDAQVARVRENFRAFPMVGKDVRLTAKNSGALEERAFAKEVIQAVKDFDDVRLIVMDHLALVHGGDFNAREDAALTMRVANHIAQETGAAVLILAHTPKSAGQAEASDASMIAGSTAFVDQSRAAWVLATMRENEAKGFGISDDARREHVSLTVVKSNYGPTGDIFWFKRVPFDAIALLEPVTLNKATAATKTYINLEGAVLTFVAQHPGEYSKSGLRDTHSGKDKMFGAAKADVAAAIAALISNGHLVNRPPTTDERAKFGHGPTVRQVLDVGP